MSPMPDYIAAMIEYLRSIVPLTALCPVDRIRGRMPEKLNGVLIQPKSPFIIVNKAGGFGADPYIPHFDVRIDIRFYHSTHHRATELWRVAHPYIESPYRNQNGFEAAGCRVLNITAVAGALELTEPERNWPVILVPYQAKFLELAI